jgi:cyclic pyranopterin phosphate synthase
MLVYDFEGIDDGLARIPLAARRAFQTTGCKVSPAAWRRLRGAARMSITSLGTTKKVDAKLVRDLLADENVAFTSTSLVRDPEGSSVPVEVARGLGGDRNLRASWWRALTPLDRFVLAYFAKSGRMKSLRRAFEEITKHAPPRSQQLSSHLTAKGEVHMVDVGGKDVTVRHAAARARVRMLGKTVSHLRAGSTPKGDVLATARVAAIMAAKRAPEIVPLCHSVALTCVAVDIELAAWGATVEVRVEARDRTGVEMEAMVGASAAALAIYDMLKGIDRGITFDVALVAKSGGKSGNWSRAW